MKIFGQHNLSEPDDAEIERVLDLMRRDDSRDAPATALQFARGLFRANQSLATAKVDWRQKIRAVLALELPALIVGERAGGANLNERQLLLTTGRFDLDVRVNQTTVRGQILGDLPRSLIVTIDAANYSSWRVVDKNGEFYFDSVPSSDALEFALIAED